MAKEYIERGALTRKVRYIIEKHGLSNVIGEKLKKAIEDSTAADVVEVRHGEWVGYESEEGYGPYDTKAWYKCSECGKDANGRCEDDEWYSYPVLSDFCPHCGAKMDGERKE